MEDLTIDIGGETTVALLGDDGRPTFPVPVYFDARQQWSNPPQGPVEVILYCDGTPIGTIGDGFTVTPLPRATGTAGRVVGDFRDQVTELRAIADRLAQGPSLQAQYLYAYLAAMEELLGGSSAGSVGALLQQLGADHPETIELLEAVYASAELDTKIQEFGDLIAEFSAVLGAIDGVAPPGRAAAPSAQRPAARRTLQNASPQTSITYITVGDTHLAFMLQFYHMLNLFHREVVSNVASGFALAANAVGVVADVPQVTIVNAMLLTYDLLMKKVVLSLMPAQLDRMELQVSPTTIGLDENVPASIQVYASNQPEPMTITDVTNSILTLLGLAQIGPNGADSPHFRHEARLLE
jgi:hypothetical protein